MSSMPVVGLLEEEYLFVLMGRRQSDPIERRFSQYRQMSGRRFLVSVYKMSTTRKEYYLVDL